MSLVSDTHGLVKTRLQNVKAAYPQLNPAETAVIILGDVGFNYYLSKRDWKQKKNASKFGYTIYCVRGNHEERPENLNYGTVYDNNVEGIVYVDPDYPLIRYFMDGGEYAINGKSCLVIGGAYSIDKWHRIEMAAWSGSKHSGWFKDEQLTKEEMDKISKSVCGKHYDFVLTHTCPFSWQPTDLFLGFINQATVDNSMEIWMEELKDTFTWGVWCFGHYHVDRIQKPCVEIFFTDIQTLEDVTSRWEKYKEISDLDWWLEVTEE